MKLQFRLRTLMIAVTLLAVPLGYVGWQAKIVRERKAMRERITKLDNGDVRRINSSPAARMQWIRELLGDEPIAGIVLPLETDSLPPLAAVADNGAMEAEPPKRHRFQFRLRTLMIVVTLLSVACAYVGRQLKWIADHREALKGHSMIDSVDEWVGGSYVLRNRTQSAPWPLGWLGEDGYIAIGYSESAPNSEVERLKELFPEANVSYDPFLPYSASDH